MLGLAEEFREMLTQSGASTGAKQDSVPISPIPYENNVQKSSWFVSYRPNSSLNNDLCRVNFEVNPPKPFPHLAFPHRKGSKIPSKIPSFDGELMASLSPLPSLLFNNFLHTFGRRQGIMRTAGERC
jgi:hypothetical protein